MLDGVFACTVVLSETIFTASSPSTVSWVDSGQGQDGSEGALQLEGIEDDGSDLPSLAGDINNDKPHHRDIRARKTLSPKCQVSSSGV